MARSLLDGYLDGYVAFSDTGVFQPGFGVLDALMVPPASGTEWAALSDARGQLIDARFTEGTDDTDLLPLVSRYCETKNDLGLLTAHNETDHSVTVAVTGDTSTTFELAPGGTRQTLLPIGEYAAAVVDGDARPSSAFSLPGGRLCSFSRAGLRVMDAGSTRSPGLAPGPALAAESATNTRTVRFENAYFGPDGSLMRGGLTLETSTSTGHTLRDSWEVLEGPAVYLHGSLVGGKVSRTYELAQ